MGREVDANLRLAIEIAAASANELISLVFMAAIFSPGLPKSNQGKPTRDFRVVSSYSGLQLVHGIAHIPVGAKRGGDGSKLGCLPLIQDHAFCIAQVVDLG